MTTTRKSKGRKPKEIRITDPVIRRRVDEQRMRDGESTSTRTATRLLAERLTQLEQSKP